MRILGGKPPIYLRWPRKKYVRRTFVICFIIYSACADILYVPYLVMNTPKGIIHTKSKSQFIYILDIAEQSVLGIL